jgi:AraC-like DNA-binding protein
MNFYAQQVAIHKQQSFSDEFSIMKVIAARKYIHTHYSEDLDLDDVCGATHTSKFHFIRLFKRYYGLTPMQYLLKVRISEAKSRLRSGDTVSMACFSVGFQSIPSFTSLFKRQTGKTPAVYRRYSLMQNSNSQ